MKSYDQTAVYITILNGCNQ